MGAAMQSQRERLADIAADWEGLDDAPLPSLVSQRAFSCREPKQQTPRFTEYRASRPDDRGNTIVPHLEVPIQRSASTISVHKAVSEKYTP